MSCKRVKTQLALMVGNDLEAAEVREVREHLRHCGPCQQHLNGLSRSLEALQAPGPDWSGAESLWPKLVVRLSQPAPSRPHRMNGWAASLAVAAACTAMFWVASHQFTTQPNRGFSPQPVTEQPDYQTLPGPLQPPGGRSFDKESDIIPLRQNGTTPVQVVPVDNPRE